MTDTLLFFILVILLERFYKVPVYVTVVLYVIGALAWSFIAGPHSKGWKSKMGDTVTYREWLELCSKIDSIEASLNNLEERASDDDDDYEDEP